MKSAYELAMERLEESAPKIELTDEQKARLAEVDNRYDSKIAERKTYITAEVAKAQIAQDFAQVQVHEQQLADDIARFERQREEEKEKLRTEFKA
ncbi:MAG: hypothetical protein AAF591_22635 [Verrucomicrobiota bacterium]